jgi:hypothetical protein
LESKAFLEDLPTRQRLMKLKSLKVAHAQDMIF